MKRFIDLTHTFTADMPVYPGDPCARLYQICSIAKEGCTDHKIESGMHVGTHMDAPLHMLEGGAYISDIPLAHFQGRGVLVAALDRPSVDESCLKGKNLRKGDVVLVRTGWDRRFRDADYYTGYPELSEGFARRLAEAGVSLVGLDTPSPDREPFPIHKILLGNDILIIENLTNLAALDKIQDFVVHAYPAKYHAEAAPVRVVAETGE